MHELAQLLEETGAAHHEAYQSTNGFDPEWPLWYADYLHDKLPTHLGRELSRSEIVHQLISAQRAQEADEVQEPWTRYYARFLGGN